MQVEIHIRPSMRIVSMQLFNGGGDLEEILHCVRVADIILYMNDFGYMKYESSFQ